MEYRSGLCSSCDAEYRIPTNFAHDQARCRQCGGTVHIGPATSEEKERERQARKKAAGPSMKERLLAKRTEAEQGVQTEAHPEAPAGAAAPKAMPASIPARKPAANVAPQPVAKPAAKPNVIKPVTPVPKAVPPKTRAASPVRKPALAKAGAATVDAGDKAGGDRKSSRRSSGGAKKRSSGGRSSSRGRGAKAAGDGDKGKGKLPIIAGALALVLAAVGFFFKDNLFGSGDAQAADNETGAVATEGDEANGDQAGEGAGDSAANAADDMPAKEAAGAEAASDDAEQAAEVAAEEPEKPKSKPGDPDSVDLLAYPIFERTSNTTEEEWEELNAQMEVALDRDAAIRQTKAIRFLKENGRKSIPVIMNRFRSVDVSSEDGNALGMQIQRMLQEMTRGRNFGWRDFDPEAGSHAYFNKRVIEQWIKSWDQIKGDLKGWGNFAKLEPEELAAFLEEMGASSDLEPEMDDTEAELDDLFD